MTGGAKELFQIIVGARQVRDLVALKEPSPIARGDFAEVCHCWSEIAQLLLLLCHRLQQLLILLLEGARRTLLGIGEQVHGLVQPDVRLSDRCPELLCCPQSGVHELLQLAQFVGKPLFSATRLIEWSMASSRPSTWSPSASSGGFPSSVSALLTAKQ